MQRKKFRKTKTYQSTTNGFILRGTVDQIIAKYEALALTAKREKDTTAEHRFLQAADHYKRIKEEENNVRE